jgi:hypothetical protein
MSSGSSNQVPHEHEFEAAHGLPEHLPRGERILWQGVPDWRLLAVQVFHVRAIAIYFAVLLGWRAANVLYDGGGASQALLAVALLAPLAVLALALLCVLAWLSARTTVYTLTNRRVVMRVGIVLSITFNLPLRQVESAGLRSLKGGLGDIALTLAPGERIAYLHLWPHVRPWQLKRTQPMLRCVADAAAVGRLLSQAAADVSADQPVASALAPQPSAQPMAQPEARRPLPGHAPLTA